MSSKSAKKRARENACLLQMSLARDGLAPPPPPKPPKDYFESDPLASNDQENENGSLIIEIDEDLQIPDISMKDTPPIYHGKRIKYKDENHAFKGLHKYELSKPNTTAYTMSRDEITEVRTHADATLMVTSLRDLSKDCSGRLAIGFDVEGKTNSGLPSTAQLSARAGEKEINAVIHLFSGQSNKPKKKFMAVNDEETPTMLWEIFKLDAFFCGCNVADDLRQFARAIGMNPADIDSCLVVDTRRVYHFADALARGGEALALWREESHVANSIISEPSLKNFAQLVDPNMILVKDPSHRNPMFADHDETRGLIPERDLTYAALDASVARSSIVGFSCKTNMPIDSLATTIGEPEILHSVSFDDIVKKCIELVNFICHLVIIMANVGT